MTHWEKSIRLYWVLPTAAGVQESSAFSPHKHPKSQLNSTRTRTQLRQSAQIVLFNYPINKTKSGLWAEHLSCNEALSVPAHYLHPIAPVMLKQISPKFLLDKNSLCWKRKCPTFLKSQTYISKSKALYLQSSELLLAFLSKKTLFARGTIL